MICDLLITGISQLATPQGPGARHGAEMNSLSIIADAAIAITGDRFVWIGTRTGCIGSGAGNFEPRDTLDLGGRAVLPGLVDPHTHAVWAGDRLNDFDARASGRTYEEILTAGGGIRSTVAATSLASRAELVALAAPRIAALVRSGATVVEVKSGYGSSVAGEIASLEAIRELASITPARVLATLLLHLPPDHLSERANYLDRVLQELIPEVARRGLATAVDIFVEREAFHPEEARRILGSALEHGLKIKMHAEQFHAIGGTEVALQMGALSVDHLEACVASGCKRFAGSGTVATLLPGVSLHLGIPAAPGRRLIDAGAAVAIGTDLNPGSSPLYSIAVALSLAVRMNGLTPKEALMAGTANAAAALGIADAGRIEAGLQADFLVLEDSDWRSLLYTMGANPVRQTFISGKQIAGKPIAGKPIAGKRLAGEKVTGGPA